MDEDIKDGIVDIWCFGNITVVPGTTAFAFVVAFLLESCFKQRLISLN